MSKIRIIIGLILASLVIATVTSGIVLAEGKVTLCHFHGGGHPFHTITVDETSVDNHLAHGDTLGLCAFGYH